MHLGTARTAYFNWLAARSTGGKFYLRIDDTDRNRSKLGYVLSIARAMDWLNLDYDDMVTQSSRLNRHRDVARDMIGKGLAEQHSGGWVTLIPKDVPDSWEDEITGTIPISADDKEHLMPGRSEGVVLLKSDGFPTYHFSTVVDDHDLEINYIIRGHDHITNTSRQVAIYKTLGWPLPKYAHVGLVAQKGSPLSKRDGASDLLGYRDRGYHPEAMLNFMARLGWGPHIDDRSTKLLPRERMLQLFFDGGKMKSSPANMDLQKLDSFDRKYKAREKKNVDAYGSQSSDG